MQKPTKVLLIESNPDDVRLIRETLSEVKSSPYRVLHAGRHDTGLEYLKNGSVDVVLLDLTLPDSDGMQTFHNVYARASHIPIIIVSVHDDEDLAMKAVEEGARDYVVKGEFDKCSLKRAIRYAMERKRADEALRESQACARLQMSEIESIYNSAHIGLCVFDRNMRYLRINEFLAQINGIPVSEHIGKTPREIMPDLAQFAEETAEKIFRTGEPLLNVEISGTTLANSEIPNYWIQHWFPLKDDSGVVVGINVVVEDITERRRIEDELKRECDSLEKTVEERTDTLSEADRKLQLELIESHAKDLQISALSARLLEAQELERAAIARDIHDVIGGRLAAIKFSLEDKLGSMNGGSTPAEERSLEEIISAVKTTIEETRRISADLRPPVLDQLGLIAAINWLCRDFRNTYGHFRVTQNVRVTEEDIPEPLKTPAFRIIQEAFHNVAEHSKAGKLKVTLQKKEGGLQVLIEDDGIGFDPSKEHERGTLGISSMKERARLSGGELEVRSGVGEGTVIMATWPLP